MILSKRFENCYILSIIGDKLSYFNGLPYIKNDNDFKKK